MYPCLREAYNQAGALAPLERIMKRVIIKLDVELVFDLDLWESELSDMAIVQICREQARDKIQDIPECDYVSVVGAKMEDSTDE